ncbi:MAG: hypothetical protein R3C18_05300 [Planctomycetaceae bacterium]
MSLEFRDGETTTIVSWSIYSPSLFWVFRLASHRLETGEFRVPESQTLFLLVAMAGVVAVMALFFAGSLAAGNLGISFDVYFWGVLLTAAAIAVGVTLMKKRA